MGSPPRYAAVTLDLDGTLADTVADLHAGCIGMLAALGRPPRSLTEVQRFVGKGMRILVARCLDGETATDPVLLEEGVRAFRHHYAQANGQAARLYPGVREGLTALRAQGLPLACVTNKPEEFTHPLLARLGIADAFAVVVGGDTTPQKKPHPEPILHACRQLGVPPGRNIHIGDSLNDVLAARAAGSLALCVPYGYTEEGPVDSAECDAVVSDLIAAAAWLAAANGAGDAPGMTRIQPF